MRKQILSLLAAATVAVAAAGAAPVDFHAGLRQADGFEMGPVIERQSPARIANVQSRADQESLDFTLAFDAYTAVKGFSVGTTVYEAFEFSAENCKLYAGKTITSVNVTTGSNSSTNQNGITDVTVFLATDLDETPFITQKGTLGTSAFTQYKVALDTPYTIEEGKPFVVGFYFTVRSANDYFLVVDGIPRSVPDGAYVGYKRLNKVVWDNVAEDYGNICMGVTIEGENMPQNGVSVYDVDMPDYAEPGKPFDIDLYLVGAAANKASSVEVEYTIGSQAAQTVQLTLPSSLGFNQLTEDPVTLSGLVCNQLGGDVPVSITVTKVNGEKNIFGQNYYDSSLSCFERANGFTRNFLIEEGTGTWCGWCPAGIVMMEYLRETYPGRYNCVALHGNDELSVSSVNAVINAYFSGFPMAIVNRIYTVSPGGTADQFQSVLQYLAAIYNYYDNIPAIATVSDIKVDFTGESQATITSTSKFALDMTNASHYRLAYYITEDNVGTYAGQPLEQSNYYAGGSYGTFYGWEGKSSPVATVYDDVARDLLGGISGFAGSVPAQVQAGEEYTYSTDCTLTSLLGSDFYVTAVLIDTNTSTIVNSTQKMFTNPSGVASAVLESSAAAHGVAGGVEISGTYTAASVYNFAGQCVATAAGESHIALPAGLYIVKIDGASAKVVVK